MDTRMPWKLISKRMKTITSTAAVGGNSQVESTTHAQIIMDFRLILEHSLNKKFPLGGIAKVNYLLRLRL